jgi:hypothetical protein
MCIVGEVMRFLRWAVPVVTLLGGLLALTFALQAVLSPAARFVRAQARWAERSPAAYQAEIVQTYRLSDFLPTAQTCSMLVEVRAGVPQMLAGDCPEALDIATIFARFRSYATTPVASRRCGYGGCVCSLSTFQATYDPHAGYPTLIRRDWRDATPGAGPIGRLTVRLPAALRSTLFRLAEERTPCPPGTPNHTPLIAPIYAEQFVIRRIVPLP